VAAKQLGRILQRLVMVSQEQRSTVAYWCRTISIQHPIRILIRVAVESFQYRYCTESHPTKEQLRTKVSFSDFERDLVAALIRQLANQFVYHLTPDPAMAEIRMNREVHDMKSRPMQFVEHETDNLLFVFHDHANAVALSKATNEILLLPRIWITLSLDSQNIE